MRILLLTCDFPSPIEPTRGIFNLQLARALSQEAELRVIAPVAWTDLYRAKFHGAASPQNSPGVDAGLSVEHPVYYFPPKILRNQYGRFLWWSIAKNVHRLVDSFHPHLVLSYWIHPDGDAAIRAARLAQARSAVIVGGSDLLLLSKNAGRRRCIRGVLQAVNHVFTVSRHLEEKALELGIAPQKVHLWRQGVDLSLFNPGDRSGARARLGIPAQNLILLWVGRLVPIKGLDILVQACAALRHRNLPFHLYLVGDGPLRQTLAADIAARGLSDRITFVGAALPHQLPDWYRAANLTILPSRSEGLPNVLRESLACGTPFVASRVGGIPEIAAGSTSRLVPPEDPDDLALAIEQALADPRPFSGPAIPITDWQQSARSLLRLLTPATRPAKTPLLPETPHGHIEPA